MTDSAPKREDEKCSFVSDGQRCNGLRKYHFPGLDPEYWGHPFTPAERPVEENGRRVLCCEKCDSAAHYHECECHKPEDAGFWCPQCGPNRPSDDDGCCGTCGADLISQEVLDQIRAARPPAPAEEVVLHRNSLSTLQRGETAGRRWCEVCKMFFPYGYGCDTPDKKHEWVVPAADLDAMRGRLEKAEAILRQGEGCCCLTLIDPTMPHSGFCNDIQAYLKESK